VAEAARRKRAEPAAPAPGPTLAERLVAVDLPTSARDAVEAVLAAWSAAPLATATELSMPVLLALGLFTRLATLPLLGMVLVIQLFVYPQSWAEHLTWAALLLLILTRGPGAIALDRFIASALYSRREG